MKNPLWFTNNNGSTTTAIAPYPYGFTPTFHRYRLDEPARKTKGQKIFVVSMGDLFGDWVPSEWIEEVFKACENAPQHTFMFLTKNPKRYKALALADKLPTYENFWYGTTTTTPDVPFFYSTKHNTFVSIEPLLANFPAIGNEEMNVVCKWFIVGAQTGPGAVPPKPEWVQNIIDQCRAAGVPIFLKNNLNWPEKIQEWPDGRRR
jgi:protein gp37